MGLGNSVYLLSMCTALGLYIYMCVYIQEVYRDIFLAEYNLDLKLNALNPKPYPKSYKP